MSAGRGWRGRRGTRDRDDDHRQRKEDLPAPGGSSADKGPPSPSKEVSISIIYFCRYFFELRRDGYYVAVTFLLLLLSLSPFLSPYFPPQ
jgi:hypothetical protein